MTVHDPSAMTLDRFESALEGDDVASRSLSTEEHEAARLGRELRAFYSAPAQANLGPRWQLIGMAGVATLLTLAVIGAGAAVAQVDLRRIPWLALGPERVETTGLASYSNDARKLSQSEALARAPFRAVTPTNIPAEFRPSHGVLLGTPAALILRFESSTGEWLDIDQSPRSANGSSPAIAVPDGAGQEIAVDGAIGLYGQGIWRRSGDVRTWDADASGRWLMVATDRLIFQVRWEGDTLTLEGARRIAAALLAGSR